MPIARNAFALAQRNKRWRLAWILAGGLAVGAASALAAAGGPGHAHAPPGANASDLTSPAAASGWG